MKTFLLFFILISTLSFSQKKKAVNKIDSVAYYSNLRDSNVKANKYKDALLYTQKAISYSKNNNLIESQAIQTFFLGKLYYDVKKYDDAIKSFNNSIALFKNLVPSSIQASAYYHLGMCYMQKRSFDNVGMSFLLATSIKMIFCYLILRPLLQISTPNDPTERINFFILFIVFLIIETLFTIRLVNEKK